MKYLLLFLISFSVAGKDLYVKLEDEKIIYSTYDKSLCQDCVKIDSEKYYDPQVYDKADELVEDITKPIYEKKSEVESCSSEKECIEKEKLKSCPDSKIVIRTIDEVYCTKILGYEKIPSGEKVPVLNEQKKIAKEEAKNKKLSDYELLKLELSSGKTLTTKQLSELLKIMLGL